MQAWKEKELQQSAAASASLWGDLILHCEAGDVPKAKKLLDQKASPEGVPTKVVKLLHPKQNWTPLFISSERGHLGVVKLLVEKKASVNQPLKYGGWTPVQIATYNGHEEVVRYLLDHQAVYDTPLTTPYDMALGDTILEIAERKKHDKLAKFLCHHIYQRFLNDHFLPELCQLIVDFLRPGCEGSTAVSGWTFGFNLRKGDLLDCFVLAKLWISCEVSIEKEFELQLHYRDGLPLKRNGEVINRRSGERLAPPGTKRSQKEIDSFRKSIWKGLGADVDEEGES